MAGKVEKLRPDPSRFLALVLSALGVAGFVYLFIRDFNIYWLILSPVIFVVYQFPAFAVFWLAKRRREARERRAAPAAEDEEPEDRRT